MSSTIIAKNIQIGTSGTATNNFNWYQPAAPDGTVRLGVGNYGATTLDAVTVSNSGNVTLSGTTTLTNISYSGTLTGGTGVVNIGSGQVYKDAAGNVGIGTSSPSYRLDAQTTATGTAAGDNTAAYFGSLASGRDVNIRLGDSVNATARIGYLSGALYMYVNGAERARITIGGDFQFNSGYGSVATAYGCRAWVNFNGQGTVAIRASGNISSITDVNVGRYTINFTNAMPDANYAFAGVSRETVTNGISVIVDAADTSRTASAFSIQTLGTSSFTFYDSAYNNIAVFR